MTSYANLHLPLIIFDMNLFQLQPQYTDTMLDDKLTKAYARLQSILQIAQRNSLSASATEKINERIHTLNTSTKINGARYRLTTLTENEIIDILEQDLKLVPRGYHSKRWLAIGMSAFGISLGVVIGLLAKNMAFLGIGLPIGLGIGALIGNRMDAKAAAEGRQYEITEG